MSALSPPLFEASTSILINNPGFGGWRASEPTYLTSNLGFVGDCVDGYASGRALLYYSFHSRLQFRGGPSDYVGGVLAVTTFKDGKAFGDVTAKVYMNCPPDNSRDCYTLFPKNELLKIGYVDSYGRVTNLARDHANGVADRNNKGFADAFASNPLIVAGLNKVEKALVEIAAANTSAGATTPNDPVAWVRERAISKTAHWNEGGVRMKCTAGRNLNKVFDVFVNKNGVWSAPGNAVGSDPSADATARRVCE